MPAFDVPETFARTMTDLYGEEGAEWLRRLPERIAACERRWSLRALPPFTLTYNYVAPAVRDDGTEVVLKLGMPDGEQRTQAAALRLYDGHGIVKLLDADDDEGIMVLERLSPGTPLTLVTDDAKATRLAASVMRELRRPAPPQHPFPTVARWAAGLGRLRSRFDGGTGPLPEEMVARAEALFVDLLGSMGEPVLLHGDLHHENIVTAQREPWLALDPKGVVGEAEYEVGALLYNPQPWLTRQPDAARLMARRVDILVDELGYERQRIVGWGFAQAVLSAWWSIEDHGYGWEAAIACAELLAAM